VVCPTMLVAPVTLSAMRSKNPTLAGSASTLSRFVPSVPIKSTCVGGGSPIWEATALALRLRLPDTDELTVTALAGATGAAGTGRTGTGTGAGAGVAGRRAPGAAAVTIGRTAGGGVGVTPGAEAASRAGAEIASGDGAGVRSGKETVRLRCGVLVCVRAGVALPGAALSGADGVLPTDAPGRSEFFAAWAAAGRLT